MKKVSLVIVIMLGLSLISALSKIHPSESTGTLLGVIYDFNTQSERLAHIDIFSGTITPIGSGIPNCCWMAGNISALDSQKGIFYFFANHSDSMRIFALDVQSGELITSFTKPDDVNINFIEFSVELPIVISPEISLNRKKLNFCAILSDVQTDAQSLLINNTGGGTLNWNISSEAQWVVLSPISGMNNGVVEVTINPVGLTPGKYEGVVCVSDPLAVNSPVEVVVKLHVKNKSNVSSPFGEFASPVDGSTMRSSIPVTGWALDDIGVENIKIFRSEGKKMIYIGDALFVEGARPDVEQAYPNYPMNYKAGWGYMMLTNFLPNGGNGTFKIHAIATDVEGHQVTLGTNTIICDNANAVKPFGAIDTPAQGGEASGGSFRNHGWVLTPPPNSILTDGSTINVFVDGVNFGHPVYNVYREDISTFFPGYANSDGAHAYFDFDTTAYDNGTYSISWTAEDSAGNVDGIGSRYFTIRNTGNSSSKKSTARFQRYAREKEPYTLSQIEVIPVNDLEPIKIKKNFRVNSGYTLIDPGEEGNFNIKIRELERIVIELSNESSVIGGYTVIGSELRPLPIGSTLDTRKGIFYWQPGLSFLGEYRFVFVEKIQNGETRRKNIIVKIEPKAMHIVKTKR